MSSLPPNDPRFGHPGGHGAPAAQPFAVGAAPSPPSIVNAPPTGPALIKALRRRWQLAGISSVVGAIVVAGLVWYFMPPAKHTVRAQFALSPMVKDPLGKSSGDVSLESFRAAQAIKLKSPLVVQIALKDPKVANLGILREVDDVVSWFEREARVSATSEIMTVTMMSDQPEEARLLLDAVTKAYWQEFVANETEARQARMTMLKKIKDDYDREARFREQAKMELARKAGGNAQVVAYQLEAVQKEITFKRDRLLNLSTEVLTLQARIKTLGDGDASRLAADDELLLTYYRKDLTYRNLEAQLETARFFLQDARQKAAAGASPLVQRKETEVADLEKQLADLRKQNRREAEAYWRAQTAQQQAVRRAEAADELDTKTKVAEGLKKEIGDAEEVAKQLNRGVVQNEYFEKTNAATDEIYKAVDLEYQRMKLDGMPAQRVKLIEDARIIPADVKARQLKLAAIGGLVTFVLILAAVALWEFRSRRVESVDQIVYGLGLPLVGTVPAMPRNRFLGLSGRMQAEEFEQWRFALQEAVATARTMLLNAARTTNLRMVMITSAMPGEGKTSLSTQLAVSLSMAGHRTLLLDFDMRSPSAFKLLGAPNTPGWAEVLRGELNVTEAIQVTAMENLWFIPAGDCDPLALKALTQDGLGELLRWLRDQYDFVIIDTCPVLPVVDALLLGRHADGIIFSILNDVSQIPKVYTATQRISSLGLRMLGAVINGIREEKYGYGYGYGYNYRSGRGKKQLPAATR